MPYNNNVRRNRSTNKKKKIKLLSIKLFRQTFAMLWHIIAKHLTVNELKLSMPGIFKYIYRLLTEPNADIQKDKE